MKIIKRNGAEVPFDITKIITAVTKASDSVGGQSRLTREQITQIAAAVTDQCQALNRAVSVEEVQDLVENQLMDIQAHDVARHYITYRYVQSLKRQTNTTDERILSLIECQNEEVKQENANKNPTVNSVQRDYMAGEISKDLTARLLLDPEIVKAHQEGLIHFHDSDYFAQHMHNCDLVNLEDMLQNGTVISGTYIEKPHSFSTACNIATQIIAQVASNQYGGQSISLTHLAPFVDVSRKKIAAEVEVEMEGLDVSAERKKEIVERRLRNEINRGVQTIQYQVVTLMTTNGQAPFITVFMYLGEARNAQEKADLAIIIEETIRQRYQGVKNEAGVWITPAFPKLIYVLEEDNIRPGTPYYYLTELAAKCTAKRMVPDYISEKKMLELKVDKNGEGHCYTCMGCRSFLTPYVDPETGKPKYYGRFNQGVVTINLVDVALSSEGNFEKFWKIFDERLDLCHRALQARVIAVAEKAVRIEAFGVECSIMARDLSWDWIGDANDRFSVGDQILVRILEVNRDSLEELSIRADVKSVSENTNRTYLKQCRVQSKYAGKVTDVHKGVVYVRLNNGANAIAHTCLDRRTPGKKDDVSFAVTHIDEDRGVAVGIITRIIKQHL